MAINFRAAAIAVLFLCTQIFWSFASLAQSARNLDLTSTAATSTARSAGQIAVNGVMQNIAKGASITPAEAIALAQMLHTGTQSLILGSSGNATGGSFNLSYAAGHGASVLNIPQSVLAVDNAAKTQTISVSGALTNSGTLQVLSQNASVNSATISAGSINNSGVITSVLPTGGVTGFTPAAQAVNLNLISSSNVLNSGTISSSGNLSLTAAGSIVNSLPTGVTGSAPLIQAANNLNLNTSNIQNAGTMAALAGNLNVATTNTLNINNVGGSLQALNGAINIRDASFTGQADTNITGGDVLSQSVNVYSGTGTTNIAVNNLTGQLNMVTGDANVSTTTSNLNLGTLSWTGDPVMVSGNNMIITGDENGNGPLQVEAPNGSITSVLPAGSSAPAAITIEGADNIVYLAMNDINLPGVTTIQTTNGNITFASVSGNVNLPNVTTISSTGTVGIAAEGGMVYAPLANITAQSTPFTPATPGTLATGTTMSTIPASVLVAAFGSVTVGGTITSPAGSVLVESGANFPNGSSIFSMSPAQIQPTFANNPGNVTTGAIDISSTAMPNYGLIFVGSGGGSVLNTGSLNGNGSTIIVQAANAVTISGSSTASGQPIPVIVNNNTSSGNNYFIGATVLFGPGGITISQPNGGIQMTQSSFEATASNGTFALSSPTTFSGVGSTGVGITAAQLTGSAAFNFTATGNFNSAADVGIDVTAGSLVVGPGAVTISTSAGPGGEGGLVELYALMNLTVNMSSLKITPGANGNGGILQMGTGGFVNGMPTGGVLTVNGAINEEGNGTGSGGQVDLFPFGNFVVGSGGNVSSISAQSGSQGTIGGSINIESGGALTVDASKLHVEPRAAAQNNAVGQGGSITLGSNTFGTLGGNLVVNGNIDVSGKGNAGGGSITIGACCGQEPVPGFLPANVTINGNLVANAGTAGQGGTIEVVADGGNVTIGSAQQAVIIHADGGSQPLTSNSPVTANGGGNIEIDGVGSVTLGTGNITLYTTSISASGRAAGGAGGSITIDPAIPAAGVGGGGGGASFPTPSITASGTIVANGNGANGGTITIACQGPITLNTTLISSSATGAAGGAGGQITIDPVIPAASIGGGGGGSGSPPPTPSITVSGQIVADGNGGNAGNIQISCAGPISLNTSLISATATGSGTGAGGSILISGTSIVSTSNNITIIRADGANSGNGGSITVQSTQTATDQAGDNGNNLTIGAGAGNFEFSAHGGSGGSASGNGGSVTVEIGGNLTVDNTDNSFLDVRALGSQGNGGTIILIAGWAGSGLAVAANGTLLVNSGNMDASAVGNGAGGTITLVGPGVEFSASSITLTANGAGSSNGGTVFLDSANPGDTFLVVGIINALGGLAGGNGGTVSVKTEGTLDLTGLTVNASAQGENGIGGSITLGGSGTFQQTAFLPPTSLTGTFNLKANGAGTSTGGNILVDAFDISNLNATMSANGGISGGSGSITVTSENGSIAGTIVATALSSSTSPGVQGVTLNSASDITLTNSRINVSATSGEDRAGIIQILTPGSTGALGGAISLTSTTLLAKGTRGSITLNSAGNISASNITVDTSMLSQGGDIAGNVTITATGTLSISGSIVTQANNQAMGGAVSMTASGITVGDSGLSINTSGGTGGRISIVSSNNILFTPTGSATTSINSSGTSANSGDINISAANGITLGLVSIRADGGQTGNGGDVTLNGGSGDIDQSSTSSTILVSAQGGTVTGNGGDISITSGGNISLLNATIKTTASGTGRGSDPSGTGITISCGGTLGVNGSIDASATSTSLAVPPINQDGGNISITAGTFDNALQLRATSYWGTGGTVSITTTDGDLVLNQSAAFDVSSNSGSGGTVVLTATGSGSVTLSTAINAKSLGNGAGVVGGQSGGAVTINGFNITINSAINATGYSSGGNIVVNAGQNITVAAPLSVTTKALTTPIPFATTGAGGEIQLNGGIQQSGTVMISANVDASVLAGPLSGALQVGNAPTIIISGGPSSSLTINSVVSADLQTGGTSSPVINITGFGAGITLNGKIEAIDYPPANPLQGPNGTGAVSFVTTGNLSINQPNNVVGSVFANIINLQSNTGAVNAFIGSVADSGQGVTGAVVGIAATGFTLTVAHDSLTLGMRMSGSLPGTITSQSGNISITLENTRNGSLQINNSVEAAAGTLTIAIAPAGTAVSPIEVPESQLSPTIAENFNLSPNSTAQYDGNVFINNQFVTFQGPVFFDTRSGGQNAPQITLSGSNANAQITVESGVTLGSYAPIAFTPFGAPPSSKLKCTHYASADFWQAGLIDITDPKNSNYINLNFGNIVVAARRQTEINAGGCKIKLASGAIVSIDCAGSVVTLRCLHDRSAQSVTVSRPGRTLKLCAGQQFVFASTLNELSDEISFAGVSLRGLEKHQEQIGCVAIAEFPLTSLSAHCRVVRMLLESSARQDLRTVRQLEKTAATLAVVTSGHGRFITP